MKLRLSYIFIIVGAIVLAFSLQAFLGCDSDAPDTNNPYPTNTITSNSTNTNTSTVPSSTSTTNQPPAGCENFTGPYSAITTTPYDSSFHGTDTIADIKSLGVGTFSTTKDVKAVITGLTNFNSNVSTRAFFVQDATAGIYVYSSVDITGITDTSIGQIIEFTTSELAQYPATGPGLLELVGITNATVRAPQAGEPTEIYVQEINSKDATKEGSVVKFTGQVADSSVLTFTSDLPNLYTVFGDSLSIFDGDWLTVVGPLTSYNGTLQVDTVHAYPKDDSTYICLHN